MSHHKIKLTDDERKEVLWAVARALDPQADVWKAEKNQAARMVLESAQRKLEGRRS